MTDAAGAGLVTGSTTTDIVNQVTSSDGGCSQCQVSNPLPPAVVYTGVATGEGGQSWTSVSDLNLIIAGLLVAVGGLLAVVGLRYRRRAGIN